MTAIERRVPLERRAGLHRRTGLTQAQPMPSGGQLARRAPLERGTGLPPGTAPMQRGGPLKPVSGKRAAENRQRAAMIDTLYPGSRGDGQDQPYCSVWQARLTVGLSPLRNCTKWAGDAHEPLSRARGGSIVDPGNVTAPCRHCHDHLHDTPESELGWAYQLGLLKGRKWAHLEDDTPTVEVPCVA